MGGGDNHWLACALVTDPVWLVAGWLAGWLARWHS
jgi:hypothetical protein